MPARHLVLGARGEEAAARHLEAKGLRILHRNLRLGRLELDLVCEQGDTLVFVEVKSRGAGSLGGPADGLTGQKCERLLRAARQYLSLHDQWSRPCRFDLVGVWEEGGVLRVVHEENALSAEEAQVSGRKRTAGWQPW